ncbi:hypothetical protein SEUCBS139899_010696 [Sporothrix eucalyptigena]|uniref:Telomeric single stranded DNA binding POT1/Cdc13 domain-containing protein n=1 Tax=Sporothrix eucalyptigena TaxID=1812306 RepID=A0ABP0D1I3_9PEZI
MSAENGGGQNGSTVPVLLAGATLIPIAQLNPDQTAASGGTPRAVRGEVTIVWPYNSVQRSLAFLLAEPDVRLRRSKGQIRVQLDGPSAAAVAESGLGGGDEVLLSLAGAGWSKDESSLKLPGSRVEWQLEFRGRLVLQAQVGEAQETHAIDVDQPETESEATATPGQDSNGNSIEAQVPPSSPPLADLFRLPDTPAPSRALALNNEEYASPAFIKRARISFGSLFEPGFDIFEEDGGVRGRGRKRTRFGRPSNAWRYSSQSVSPEREPEPELEPEPEPELKETTPQAAELHDEATEVASSPPVPLEAVTPTPARPQPVVTVEETPVAPLSSAPPTQISASFQQEVTHTTEAVPISTSIAVSVSNPAPEAPMGGIPNPFAPAPRATSALFGSAAPLSSASNPFAVAPSPAAANPFTVPSAAPSAANPFAASAAAPFETTGADAMGFVPDDNLFNDHVRFSFGDHANTFDQHPPLDPALQDPAPPEENPFGGTPYHYPEPPTQHETSHAEPQEPPRSTRQDHVMVWPIDAPALDAEHAEVVIPASSLPPSHPADAETAQRDAAASFIASGANDGVFEDNNVNMDEATDLPREVDNFGYNDRRYQNEEEEQEVGMVDDELPTSRQSDEDEDENDLASDGPEEAEPKDHLIEGDQDEEDAEGEDDDHVEIVGDDDDESEEDEDEVELTDQAGDDYDMRNYENVDDDIEGEDVNEGGAATFNGEGEDEEDEEEEDERDEEEEDYDEDADAEAYEDNYTAPQRGLLPSHSQQHDDDGGSEEYDEEEGEDEEFGEGEEDGEGFNEEEDYDEEEEEEYDEEEDNQPPMYRAPARSQPSEPVVIDLLSDSDDDNNEPAPPPPRQQSKLPVSETPIPPPTVPAFGRPSGTAAASSPPEVPTEEATEASEEEADEEDEEEEEEEVIGEHEEDGEGEDEEEDKDEGVQEDDQKEEDVDAEAEDDKIDKNAAEPTEEPKSQPAPDQTAADAESEPEDELERELEAELEAELAADDKASEEAKAAKEAKSTEEAKVAEEVQEAEAVLEVPADAERVEAVAIEEPKEVEKVAIQKSAEEVAEAVPPTEEQPQAEEPQQAPAFSSPPHEPADVAEPATEVVDEQKGTEAAPESTTEPVVDEQLDQPEEQPIIQEEPPTEPLNQDRPDAESEDVAMADADADVEILDVVDQVVIEGPEKTEPEKTEPPQRTLRSRNQAHLLAAQENTSAATPASATSFSPPATQLGASQDAVRAVDFAVREPSQRPDPQATEVAPPAAPTQLPTPMQTQEGGSVVTQYTPEMASFSDADIDGQVQSQLLSEMAMSFDFDHQADVDMRSVVSAQDQEPAAVHLPPDVDMTDHDEEMDEEQQVVAEQHGESMDVDAGTDIDMQSVVSEQPTVVIEDEVDLIVTEPAIVEEEVTSTAVVAPTEEEEPAAPTLHKDANENEEQPAENEPPGQAESSTKQEQQEQPKTQHLEVPPPEQPPTATSASPPTESRHKMSLRSTQSRLRRSLSPQPVDINAKIAVASAALAAAVAEPTPPDEPDTSVQIARTATTRRSKRAQAGLQQSQDESAVNETSTAHASTTAPKTRAAVATATATATAEADKEGAGEDVSVLMARAATSRKRASKSKEKDEKKEAPKEQETTDDKATKDKETEKEKKTPEIAPAAVSMAEVKLALDRGRATVPDCMPLRNLRPHLTALLDVAVIATSSSNDDPPQRTRSRQYAMSLTVTDPSLVEHVSASIPHLRSVHATSSRKTSPTNALASGDTNNDAASDTGSVSLGLDIDAIVEVSLYRAHKETLPTFRAGDGLLLRRFEVVALHDKGFGLRSTEESAYAVFPAQAEENSNNESGAETPQVNGPPVEDMDREAQYIALLKQWYRLLDEGAHAQLEAAKARFVAVDIAARAAREQEQR